MWFLNCRTQTSGGSVRSVQITDGASTYTDGNLPPEFLNSVRGRHVLIGVHGFNVHQAGGVDHLEQWSKLLTLNTTDLFLGSLWPGDSTWLGALEYPFAAKAAIRSGDALAAFINATFTQALSISFVSHSLGARVALRAIQQLNVNFTIRRLIMMAPAVDDDCLTREFAGAARRVASITVLASEQDKVLEIAFPLGNPISGIIAQGHPYWHAALGREGPAAYPRPNNIQAGWLIPKSWKVDHGDYLPPQSPFAPPYAPTPFPLPVIFPASSGTAPYDPTPQGYYVNKEPKNWQCGWTAAVTSIRFQ